MPHPLVSILVPIYNVESYIERCARSLFEQTYENLEFIFADDCSPDRSMEILERVINDYPQRANQICIIHHAYNRGLAAVRNTLVDNSLGDFICHVDSDDWMERNAVELLVKKQEETDADIITGQVLAHYRNREELWGPGDWKLGKEILLENIMNGMSSTSLWRRLIRHSLYTNHDIHSKEGSDCSEDFQVFPRLLYFANEISGIPAIIYNYECTNGRSYTHIFKGRLDMQLQILASRKVISDFFSDRNKHLKNICDKRTTHIAHYLMRCNLWNFHKKGYYIIYNELTNNYRHYWAQIGWNDEHTRLAEGSFEMMYIKFIVNRIISKSKRIISYAQ